MGVLRASAVKIRFAFPITWSPDVLITRSHAVSPSRGIPPHPRWSQNGVGSTGTAAIHPALACTSATKAPIGVVLAKLRDVKSPRLNLSSFPLRPSRPLRLKLLGLGLAKS